MKTFISLGLVAWLTSLSLLSFGQTISQYAYWFDNNFADRVTHPHSGATLTLNTDISTDGLADGVHLFSFHAKQSDGVWSVPLTQFFIKTPPSVLGGNLTNYEYWIDNDRANLVTKTVAAGQTTFSFDANTQNLQDGVHLFTIRFKQDNGLWSVPLTQFFIKTPPSVSGGNLTNYEYWIDNDRTNLVSQTVAAGQTTFSFDANTQTLQDGVHLFTIRFKQDNGLWSVPLTQFFVKTPPSVSGGNLTNYEYWIDNDRTNLVTQTVAAGQTTFSFDANTQTLQDGVHLFTIRFKQDNGLWSVPLTQFFIKTAFTGSGMNQIVAYEYWFDGDFANRQLASVTPTAASIRLVTDIPVNLTQGFHKLYSRFKDTNEKWSDIVVHPFSNFKRGVTVIVHGFAAPLTGFPSWTVTMAEAIGNRVNYGAIVYKNDPSTGKWVHQWGDPTDTTREIILLYDWADLSNNGLTSLNFGGNGYLESAADNLFAMLLTVPVNLGSPAKILDRPMHFIGHSRGTILCLQVFHRLKKYFPTVNVEQFTALDPHPASTFGDVHSDGANSPTSLPCVQAQTFGYLPLLGSANGSLVSIKIPDNVNGVDDYFRQDGDYELATDLFSFDGVPLNQNTKFSRQLSENLINAPNCGLAPDFGGSHSKVHAWYYGTIKSQEDVTYSGCTINNAVPLNWYKSNIFVNQAIDETRTTTGFNYSRLGGISYPEVTTNRATLTEMETALSARTGYGLRPVFNGDFYYGDGGSGWTLNGSPNSISVTSSKMAKVGATSAITHSYFYFASDVSVTPNVNYTHLKFKAKYDDGLFTTYPVSVNLKIYYENTSGNIKPYQITTTFNSSSDLKTYYCPIPSDYQQKVGKFTVGTSDDVFVDDFEFVRETPVSNILQPSFVLPIELLTFKAQPIDADALLTWQTISEKNAAHFEIERSIDGKIFEKIGEVKAIAAANSQQKYQFLDKNLPHQYRIYYYRLHMVDLDKKEQLSKIEAINFNKTERFNLTVYPNPTTDIVTINGSTTKSGKVDIQLTNSIGQIVFKHNLQTIDNTIQLNVDMSAFPSGLYYLTVQNAYALSIEKIIKL